MLSTDGLLPWCSAGRRVYTFCVHLQTFGDTSAFRVDSQALGDMSASCTDLAPASLVQSIVF
jgi:hypothetical protein